MSFRTIVLLLFVLCGSNAFALDSLEQLRVLSEIQRNQQQSINSQRLVDLERQKMTDSRQINAILNDNVQLIEKNNKLKTSVGIFSMTSMILTAKNVDFIKGYSTDNPIEEEGSKKYILSELIFYENICNNSTDNLKYMIDDNMVSGNEIASVRNISEIYSLIAIQIDSLKKFVLSSNKDHLKNYQFNNDLIQEKIGSFYKSN
jgi:hypothetical protein